MYEDDFDMEVQCEEIFFDDDFDEEDEILHEEDC